MSFDKTEALKVLNKVKELGGELIAVSKKFSLSDIKKAHQIGVSDFGENYVEEALAKIAEVPNCTETFRWHFIGKIQSNNINKMIDKFEVIHSLYKFKHIKKFNKGSKKTQKILIQIRHEKDSRENGVFFKDLESLLLEVKDLPMINLKGLMFMPPEEFSKKELEFSFADIKKKFNQLKIKSDKNDWDMISMGMSSDFEMALEMGATHVRIGTAIFGSRT